MCASCSACYVGGTTRHLTTWIKEHLSSDKQSHVYKHINSSIDCKALCNESCFSILDVASTQFTLRIKEGMHIK